LRIIHDWQGLAPEDRGAAVAFGNFDGVHLGHQQVIAGAAEAARRLGAPLGVASLDPHPRRLFHPNEPAFRLMTLDQQARALAELGVERFYLLPFDFEMAGLTDADFVLRVLSEGLGVRHVAVGFDVSFGKDRTGSPEAMARYGETLGFTVSVAEAFGDADGKFSSTAIREALRDGQPEEAARMLGRPFAIEGVVRRGQQLGRQLGIPTANIFMDDYVVPRLGVYATRTRLPDGRIQPGVANLGVNPTTGVVETRLEVWLFDFDEDLYGQVLETQLLAFLRPEEKFASIDAMMAQIRNDEAQARTLLGA
jgi:riboflavin kinase/FMN adenylyltransferase